jgi:hypothetical protein
MQFQLGFEHLGADFVGSKPPCRWQQPRRPAAGS